MKFEVGDKVMCVHSYGMNHIEAGKTYTVLEVIEKDDCIVVDWNKILKPLALGSYKAWRFQPVIEEDIRSGFDLDLGIVYGILYDRIKDTDEDLWIVAETIAEALGEVEDKL